MPTEAVPEAARAGYAVLDQGFAPVVPFLNQRLAYAQPAALDGGAALHPIADAAQALGAGREEARLLMVDAFAHAAGLLLLAHTGRIRMFGASAPNLMERFVERTIAR